MLMSALMSSVFGIFVSVARARMYDRRARNYDRRRAVKIFCLNNRVIDLIEI